MKNFIIPIIAFMAFAFPMAAESDGQSSSTPITLASHPIDDKPNQPVHRTPMRVCVEAWYEATTSTLSIIYYGEAEGEVNLYLDGELIDSSSVINTTFQISEAGLYTIEIITDAWTATGSIHL